MQRRELFKFLGVLGVAAALPSEVQAALTAPTVEPERELTANCFLSFGEQHLPIGTMLSYELPLPTEQHVKLDAQMIEEYPITSKELYLKLIYQPNEERYYHNLVRWIDHTYQLLYPNPQTAAQLPDLHLVIEGMEFVLPKTFPVGYARVVEGETWGLQTMGVTADDPLINYLPSIVANLRLIYEARPTFGVAALNKESTWEMLKL